MTTGLTLSTLMFAGSLYLFGPLWTAVIWAGSAAILAALIAREIA